MERRYIYIGEEGQNYTSGGGGGELLVNKASMQSRGPF
jgi:hypothetical protein